MYAAIPEFKIVTPTKGCVISVGYPVIVTGIVATSNNTQVKSVPTTSAPRVGVVKAVPPQIVWGKIGSIIGRGSTTSV